MSKVEALKAIMNALRGKSEVDKEHLAEMKGEGDNAVMIEYIQRMTNVMKWNRTIWGIVACVTVISFFFGGW